MNNKLLVFLCYIADYWFVLENYLSDLGVSHIDIPSFEQMVASGCSDVWSIRKLVDGYQVVPKDDCGNLYFRVDALLAISEALKDLPQGSRSDAYFSRVSRKKANYLKALDRLYEDGVLLRQSGDVYNRSLIEDYFIDNEPSAYKNGSYTPIVLHNKRHFDEKQENWWGEYWLEIIDPCHRALDNEVVRWIDVCSRGLDTPPFFLWLEGQRGIDFKSIKVPSNKDLQETVAIVRDGKLFVLDQESNMQPLTTIENPEQSNEQLFVIRTDGRILTRAASKEFRHTSLSQGKSILGAGIIEVQNGVFRKILFSSGHYLLNMAQAFQTYEILKEGAEVAKG